MSNKIFEWIERYLGSNTAEKNPHIESESGAQRRVDEHESASYGVHGVGESNVESEAGAQQRVDEHESSGSHDQVELPSGYEIGEESEDLVIRDTNGDIVFRKNKTGSWSFENNNVTSIETATVGSLEAEKAQTRNGYENVTSSRALSTTEINDTGSDLNVSVVMKADDDEVLNTTLEVGGVAVDRATRQTGTNNRHTLSATVPSGESYIVDESNDAVIDIWVEQQ